MASVDTTLPILIVTAHADSRTLAMLEALRCDGIYDVIDESPENLPTALRAVMKHRAYLSPNLAERLKQPKDLTRDALTPTEQRVLSVIGDWADDQEASERLKIARFTAGSHRKAIMRKLELHQKGELVRYAVQHGYVLMTPQAIYQPGFQRQLQSNGGEPVRGGVGRWLWSCGMSRSDCVLVVRKRRQKRRPVNPAAVERN